MARITSGCVPLQVRERCRLQSLPDRVEIEGTYTEQNKQVSQRGEWVGMPVTYRPVDLAAQPANPWTATLWQAPLDSNQVWYKCTSAHVYKSSSCPVGCSRRHGDHGLV